jgi:hypothetical protein
MARLFSDTPFFSHHLWRSLVSGRSLLRARPSNETVEDIFLFRGTFSPRAPVSAADRQRTVRRFGMTTKKKRVRCAALGHPWIAVNLAKEGTILPVPQLAGGVTWCLELRQLVHGRIRSEVHRCGTTRRNCSGEWCCPCSCECVKCGSHGTHCPTCVNFAVCKFRVSRGFNCGEDACPGFLDGWSNETRCPDHEWL